MDISVTKVTQSRRNILPSSPSELGFGRFFTDHMFLWDYEQGRGWHSARIVPYAPLVLDPASTVLHYGQQVFEGLKAYRGAGSTIRLFRHRDHLQRFQRSMKRLCMPELDGAALAQGLEQLLLLDRDWIPTAEGTSVYIRPNAIGIAPYLGVKPAETYLIYIILSPVGAYYQEGFNPVRILVEERYARAVRGGVGEAKTGGNYGASLLAQQLAHEQGYAQVLWLDACERRYVEEVGTMNMFFVFDNEIVTSPLSGSVLAGITRDSVLQLLRRSGSVKVSERPLAIDEVVLAAKSGHLREAFGTGTAAVISPVASLSYHGAEVTINGGKTGPISQQLFDELTAIQYGRAPDPFGWVHVLGR